MRVESSPATQSLGRNISVARRIFTLILGISLIASLVSIISASAAENVFKITDTDHIESSQNVEEDFEATDEASISEAILFHKVGDYAKFKITFKNSDSINHVIESITDENDNEYISLEYADYAGTEVSAGDSFDFILTVKYKTAVANIEKRDQDSTIKLYIKYAESEDPDEINIDPSSPDTSDKLSFSIIVLIVSGACLIICIAKSKRYDRKTVKIAMVILAMAMPFMIHTDTNAASEGTDIITITSEFNLYDRLVITIDDGTTESEQIVDYGTTVGSITKPEAEDGYEFGTWKDEDGNPISDSAKLTEDTKLVASFKTTTYTIAYAGLDDLSQEEIATLDLPEAYTVESSFTLNEPADRKDEYDEVVKEFKGWSINGAEPTKNAKIENQTGNKNIEAVWEDITPTEYHIYYDYDGGSATNTETFTRYDEVTVNNPVKDTNYYTFDHWTSSDYAPADGTKDIVVPKGTKQDIHLKANYETIKYRIVYDGLTDAEVEDLGYTTEYDITTGSISLANTPNPRDDEDTSFDKWTTDSPISLNNLSNISLAGVHEDITITANWKANTHDIVYRLNNGTNPSTNPSSFTKNNLPLSIGDPTRDYYIFDGWTSSELDISNPTKNVTIPTNTKVNVTLTAIWTPVEYDIDYSGLTDTEVTQLGLTKKYTVETGSISLTNPADRTEADEHFTGWSSSDINVSNPSNVSLADKHANITIAANWEANTHTISYELNDGTVSPANPTSFTKNTETFTLNEPTKTGYIFRGWSGTDLVGTDNKNVQVVKGTKKDLAFEANYDPIQYTVNFDVNFENTDDSDTTTMDSRTFTYGVKESLPTNTFDVKGYTFTGWKDANDTEYLNEAEIENLCNTAGCSVTLYAQWTPNADTPYTIELYFENVNDDNYTLDSTETKHKTGTTGEQTAVIDFNKPSYSFTGFNYDHGDPASLQATIDRHDNTVIKLYYKRIRYNITFHANGGIIDGTESETGTKTRKYGATIEETEFLEATKSNSDFDGWYTAAEGGEKVTSITVPANNDTVVYAHWTSATLCKKAEELHVETCKHTDGSGCAKDGYSANGTKKTTTMIIGNISDGTDTFANGDAFDCNVSGDSYDRFYFIRTNGDNAVLYASDSYESTQWGHTNHFDYNTAIQKLPIKSLWNSNLVSFTYDSTEYAARLPKYEDISASCNITKNYTYDCDFLFENTKYTDQNVPKLPDNGYIDGIWTEYSGTGSYYRIQTNTLNYEGKTNSSKNIVRPVIEVPMSLMDTHALSRVTVTFDARGGDAITSKNLPKGGALRLHELPVATHGNMSFAGWYKDEDLTEPFDSMPVNENITLYAKFEAVARTKDEDFPSLQAAVNSITADDGEEEVILLKDTTEATISINNGQNIILNLEGHTLTAQSGCAISLNSGSKTKFISGKVTSSQPKNATINVNEGSELIVTGGTIEATGDRAAIYVNGGTLSIYDGAEITATTNVRAAIHNTCQQSDNPSCSTPGTINIYGGTIISTGANVYALYNEKGTINIGNKDGNIKTNAPTIRGEKYGAIKCSKTSNSINFYDGTIEGKTYPTGTTSNCGYTPTITNDTSFDIITDIEASSLKQLDTSGTYQKLYLVDN